VSGARLVRVATELDVADAARAARDLAEARGLTAVEAQHVATAVSEVAMNAWKYAGGGEVELAPAEQEGRRGLVVVVRDRGPGIADVAAAMRDGSSSGGSLGLGLPGARRLMDGFALESRPGRTVVRMARWAGGPPAGELPVRVEVRPGAGGAALAQPYRNGFLLALAAGPRAEEALHVWRPRPWHAPARLAEAARHGLDPGDRLGVALAGFSALDGRLAWLSAGAVGAVLLRRGRVAARAPGGHALAQGGGVPQGAVVDACRDDVLVLAAAALDDAALAGIAAGKAGPGAPAALVAHITRGVMERRPAFGGEPDRRATGAEGGTTLERP
jgi:serine/threonine-protein kinase RsbT